MTSSILILPFLFRSVEWDNELGVVNLCLNQVAYSGLLVAAGSLATSANLEHEGHGLALKTY